MPVINGLTPELIQYVLIGVVAYLVIEPLILFFAARLIDLPAATYWRSLLAAVLNLLVAALGWLALTQTGPMFANGIAGLAPELTDQVFAFVVQLACLLVVWWILAQVFRGSASQGFAVLLAAIGLTVVLGWLAAFVIGLIDPALLPPCNCCGLGQPPA